MNNRIDHFAIGAATLEAGVDAMRTALGVTVPAGSKHTAMSTHNCAVQAGNDSFLEIIAVDPDAPDPGRRRWFTLDEAATRRRLSARPSALCWVVGTDDLDAVMAASPVDLGEAVLFTRGERSWRLTVPRDGSLPEHGLLPAFIEWSPGPHPSGGMQDLGITLQSIELQHPDPARLQAMLDALGVAHLARVTEGNSRLAFRVDSPNGAVVLD